MLDKLVTFGVGCGFNALGTRNVGFSLGFRLSAGMAFSFFRDLI